MFLIQPSSLAQVKNLYFQECLPTAIEVEESCLLSGILEIDAVWF